MKVYLDANIYVTHLLGQRGEEMVADFFRKSAACLFSLAVSKLAFAEVAQACNGTGIMLLQKHIDDFKSMRKIEVIEKTAEDDENAKLLNIQTGRKYGFNDCAHALLAKKHADVFVTDDKKLSELASQFVKTFTLKEFLASKPQAP